MAKGTVTRTPWWAWVWPLLAWVVLAAQFAFQGNWVVSVVEAATLIATVFAAVYHPEVVAHRVGEPYGSLVLALCVTIIEVALIVSVMITGGTNAAALARDTIFAAVMIVCNGIVGVCLLSGGVRLREQGFQLQGANAALSVLIALTTLTMVFPNVTVSSAGPTFSEAQLIFAAIVSVVLYGSFLFVQTIRHRDYFLPVGGGNQRCTSSGFTIWDCRVGESTDSHGGAPGGGCRSADECDWNRDCRSGVVAGGTGGVSSVASQQVANQHEPGLGLGGGEHRADDSSGGYGFCNHASTADAGPRTKGS